MTQHAVHDLPCWRVPVLIDRHRRSLVITAVTSESAAARALVLASSMCKEASLDGEPVLVHERGTHDTGEMSRRRAARRRPRR